MSMNGNFLLLSDQRICELLADPPQVRDVCGDGSVAGDDVFVDVGKAWHCLHFLLTGTADDGDAPRNFITVGGREVGREDVGYGPARALMSDELVELALALGSTDRDALIVRFDAAEMDRLEIYPDAGRWSEVDPNIGDAFGYYLDAFDALKALIERGVTAGLGMLVWLS